eukprot:44792_1
MEKGNGEESPTRDFDTNEDSTSAEEEVDFNGEDTIYIPVIEPPVLCVMRHSTRLDVAMHEWKMQHEGNEEEEQQRWPEYWPEWPDQHTRPYDTPICDERLPVIQASELLQMGFKAESNLYCSPFRRCLQTAGILARSLNLNTIMVHRGLGERMDRVRKECNIEMKDDHGERNAEAAFSLISEEDMQACCTSHLRNLLPPLCFDVVGLIENSLASI